MKQGLISYLIATLFKLLFTYMTVCEVLYYAIFFEGLKQLPLVARFAREISWWLPAVQLCIAGMLMNQRWRFTGLFASFSLMLLFTWYGIIIIFFMDGISCCGGNVYDVFTWSFYLVFNSSCVLLLSLAVLFYRPLSSMGVDYKNTIETLPRHSL